MIIHATGDPDLPELRRQLHRYPELSGAERQTSARLLEVLRPLALEAVLEQLGGTGLAVLLRGDVAAGRPVLIRCELDALPIPETLDLPHGSTVPGVSHKCGHDGHMAIAVGVGRLQRAALRAGGRAPGLVLLFQPAEETGKGAQAVVADGRLDAWAPRAALALHNLPGFSLGAVVTRAGAFASASVGMDLRLHGAPAHAADPAPGGGAAGVLARLAAELPALPRLAGDAGLLLTVTHLSAGAPGFGIAPGAARLMATLRAVDDGGLAALRAAVLERVELRAEEARLRVEVDWREAFPALENDAACVGAIRATAGRLGHELVELERPMRWSEDFAHLARRFGGAMFGLGAGGQHPPLHDEAYDFPDELLEPGARLLYEIASALAAGEA